MWPPNLILFSIQMLRINSASHYVESSSVYVIVSMYIVSHRALGREGTPVRYRRTGLAA